MAGEESEELKRREGAHRERVSAHAHVLAAAAVRAARRQPVSEAGGVRPRDRLGLGRADGDDPAHHRCQRRVTYFGGKGSAERIIDRYELTGGGAEAVKDIFSPPSGTSTSIGVIGFLLLHGRGPELLPWRAAPVRADLGARPAERSQHVQRAALGRRAHSVLGLSGLIHSALGRSHLELGAALLGLPLTAVFLVWSGRVDQQRLATVTLPMVRLLGERPCTLSAHARRHDVTARRPARACSRRLVSSPLELDLEFASRRRRSRSRA